MWKSKWMHASLAFFGITGCKTKLEQQDAYRIRMFNISFFVSARRFAWSIEWWHWSVEFQGIRCRPLGPKHVILNWDRKTNYMRFQGSLEACHLFYVSKRHIFFWLACCAWCTRCVQVCVVCNGQGRSHPGVAFHTEPFQPRLQNPDAPISKSTSWLLITCRQTIQDGRLQWLCMSGRRESISQRGWRVCLV